MSIRFTNLALLAFTTGIAFAAHADVITDWNAIAANTIITNANRPPAASIVDMAYVHAAIYDAVNAIDGRFQPYAVSPAASSEASIDAAAGTAAYRVLRELFPTQAASLDATYGQAMAGIPDSQSKSEGVRIGNDAAAGLMAFRAGDGRNDSVPYIPGDGPGVWRPTPPAFAPAQTPWVAKMRPFALLTPSQFRADGPPSLNSPQWAADFNEVKELGSLTSATSTPEQREIGRFYSEHTGAQYSRCLRQFALERGMSVADNARLFAMLYISGADALIAVWDSKFHFNFWRPVTAIAAADTDGNDATVPDAGWSPLVTTPPHPEYPAAHGAFTGAIAGALDAFFGTKKVKITLSSVVTGTARSFDKTDELIHEIVEARIYGGMHYRTSGVHGTVMGRKVARWISSRYFQAR